MSDLNVVALNGRLTKDAELKYTAAGMAIASISIANNQRVKKGDAWVDDASFFDVTYFGKGAEAVHPYLAKGKLVAVTGKLRQERWEKDGEKRSRVSILADMVLLMGGGDEQQGGNHDQQERPTRQARPAPTSDDGFHDDIPF